MASLRARTSLGGSPNSLLISADPGNYPFARFVIAILTILSYDLRMTQNLLRNGLIAAASMNVGGVILFSKGFTNKVINEADPVVMSNFGLLMIAVWGLAYWGASAIRSRIPWLLAAFAIEKLVYVVVWAKWLYSNSLSSLYNQDLFAGIFYSIYGVNDFVFMLFFSWAFFSQSLKRSQICEL